MIGFLLVLLVEFQVWTTNDSLVVHSWKFNKLSKIFFFFFLNKNLNQLVFDVSNYMDGQHVGKHLWIENSKQNDLVNPKHLPCEWNWSIKEMSIIVNCC